MNNVPGVVADRRIVECDDRLTGMFVRVQSNARRGCSGRLKRSSAHYVASRCDGTIYQRIFANSRNTVSDYSRARLRELSGKPHRWKIAREITRSKTRRRLGIRRRDWNVVSHRRSFTGYSCNASAKDTARAVGRRFAP